MKKQEGNDKIKKEAQNSWQYDNNSKTLTLLAQQQLCNHKVKVPG